jgi:Fur family transcriptional regulator, peroxide stress response regulator
VSDQRSQALEDFRRRCKEQGLAFTFQRQVIYEAVVDSHEHPTPEWIYERVRQRIPSISLGTIYKNVKTFLDSGVLQEVTLHHGSLRLESNMTPHHHLVCSSCKAIFDIEESAVEPVRLPKKGLPAGFSIRQCRVEFVGACKSCQTAQQRTSKANSRVIRSSSL